MGLKYRLSIAFILAFLGPQLLAAQDHYQLIENDGQWPDHVRGQVEIENGRFWFEDNTFTYDLMDLSAIADIHGTDIDPLTLDGPRIKGHVYKAKFQGANVQPIVEFEGKQPNYFNYFLGSEENWRGHVDAWSGAFYRDLYPGVDLHLYSHDFALKYDMIVAPSASTEQIQIEYEGADDLVLENGRLIITTSVGNVIEQKPIAWQIIDGSKEWVTCEYALSGNTLSFNFPDGYDSNFELLIDPVLLFSTYSGSTSDNFGFTAAFDNEGYLYAGSSSFGTGYPFTPGAYQTTWAGGDGQGFLAGTDIAITKYDVSGTFRVYSTYLGGANDELPHSLICNDAGELIVFGTTSSPDFPVTSGAYSTSFNGGSTFAPSGVGVEYVNGSDIIVTKFNADGTDLSASTFLGGTGNDGVNTSSALKFNYADEFRGEVELDNDENIYIASCTFSTDFPTVGAFQNNNSGGLDGCITKLTPELDQVIYSSYLGSTNDEGVYSIAVTPGNDIYICGGTNSSQFPTTAGAYQEAYGGGTADGFVTRIDEDGNGIEFSTLFGSSAYDQNYFIEVNTEGIPHIYGQTLAGGSSFIFNAAYSNPNSGMIVTKFTEALDDVTWSTQFGSGSGEPNLSPTAFLVDVCGKIYLSGWGGTTNTSSNSNTDLVFGMDITDDAYQSTTNGSDFYLMVLEDDASDIVYGSYFGGGTSAEHVDGGTSRFDRKGQIYQSVCAGCGGNDDFPIFPANAVSPTNNSTNCNNGVFKFDFQLPITVADFTVPPIGCINEQFQVQNNSNLAVEFFWDFGDNTTSTLSSPIHFYEEPGEYEIMLVASNPQTCNMVDTVYRTIEIFEPQFTQIGNLELCEGESVVLGPVPQEPTYTYEWTPAETLDNANTAEPTATPTETTEYLLLIDTPACVDTLVQVVEITPVSLEAPDDIVLCGPGDSITLTATSDNPDAEWVWASDPDFDNVLNDGPDDNSIDILADEEATFYVQVSDGNCSRTEEVNLSFVVGVLNLGTDQLVCAGDTITVDLLTPLPGFELNWTTDAEILSGQGTSSLEIVIENDTVVILDADDGEGCEVSGSIDVMVSGITLDDINAIANPSIIGEGQTSDLSAQPTGFAYSWTPEETLDDPNSGSPIASPEETTTYFVTISDGECVYLDSVQVRVLDFICGPPNIYVPNAFTPNSDTNNDRLFVRGNNLTRLYFVIYNRWGEMVFETRNLDEGWDAKYKGEPVDPAVFVYYLEAVCEDGQEYFEKGNITVIR